MWQQIVLGVQVRQDGEGGAAVGEQWEGVLDVQEAGGISERDPEPGHC